MKLKAVLERGDDPEVPAAAAQGPEQIRVAGLAGDDASPVAVTTWAERRLSQVRPNRRCSIPIPPFSAKPPTPVSETWPVGTASPNNGSRGRGRPAVAPP